MSNALEGRDGSPASETGSADGTRFGSTREGAGGAASVSFDGGLFGTESVDDVGDVVERSLVTMAGAAGAVVAAGIGVGAWLSLGTPTHPAGSAVPVVGLLVAAAFALRTRRRLAALDRH